MESSLRVALPLYFLVYVFVCFIWRIIAFQRATGINPIILGRADTPHGYVNFMLKVLAAVAFISIAGFVICPESYAHLPVFVFLNLTGVRFLGFGCLVFSLVLTAIAQIQMGKSWRVGIETKEKTELVQHGIYRYSRNPIYLGVLMVLIGFFLVLPNALNLYILIFGYTTLQILIRLEEAHMRSLHLGDFDVYCKKVRRWL